MQLAAYLGRIGALLAGAMVPLAMAPHDYWVLILCSGFLLLHLLCGQNWREALWRGWFYGFAVFAVGVSWVYVSIHHYGGSPAVVAVILTILFCMAMALFFCVPAVLFAVLSKKFVVAHTITIAYWRWTIYSAAPNKYAYMMIVFPIVWVIGEWLRSWLLTGFPWLYYGYALIDTPLKGWAPIIGTYGMGLIGTMSVSLLYFAMHASAKQRWFSFVAIVLLWGGGFFWHYFNWVTPSPIKPPAQINLIQANIPIEYKWEHEYRTTILDIYYQMMKSSRDADIAIWSEGAVPQIYRHGTGLLGKMDVWGRENSTTIIAGTVLYAEGTAETPNRFYNAVVSVGNGSGQYAKRRLVPFGEYVPLGNWIRNWTPFFDLPMSDFTPGTESHNLFAGVWELSPSLCYEISYFDQVAAQLKDADFIVTISDDSWFGDSFGPHQHLQIARMRAMELGRYLLRATNNGISAVVDQRGNIVHKTEQFKRTIVHATAIPYTGKTPFAYFGSIPLLFSVAFVFLYCLYATFRRQAQGPLSS